MEGDRALRRRGGAGRRRRRHGARGGRPAARAAGCASRCCARPASRAGGATSGRGCGTCRTDVELPGAGRPRRVSRSTPTASCSATRGPPAPTGSPRATTCSRPCAPACTRSSSATPSRAGWSPRRRGSPSLLLDPSTIRGEVVADLVDRLDRARSRGQPVLVPHRHRRADLHLLRRRPAARSRRLQGLRLPPRPRDRDGAGGDRGRAGPHHLHRRRPRRPDAVGRTPCSKRTRVTRAGLRAAVGRGRLGRRPRPRHRHLPRRHPRPARRARGRGLRARPGPRARRHGVRGRGRAGDRPGARALPVQLERRTATGRAASTRRRSCRDPTPWSVEEGRPDLRRRRRPRQHR